MTITPIEHGDGKVLGFAVSGDVTRDDYQALTPAVGAAIDEHGSVSLLLDLKELHREKISAWGADLHFGREYHDKIDRMAIVGDKRWEEHLAHLASPWYAKESAFFDDAAAAWAWLDG